MGGLRFYMSERDCRCTSKNNKVMVIGETNASESGDNNFYGVLDEELHAQYPMERKVWLFKCRWIDVDPTIVERSVVCHVTDDFIDDVDEHLSHEGRTNTMSSFLSDFDETDVMLLKFSDDLDNPAKGSPSVSDSSDESNNGHA
ncbi:hypothetical protein E6C27_scaffold288G00160 [Cucumis melo var. makuwa]|uniref:CACTA en-spm transposon protein n=1 Tax=Cucumis melo var. makuwa TaxID=1194695 RepID=A0A5A7USM0_CUCMM|nr:hypothetical protein E6C27_scaffold288G00160 [Cucumis melo var. makuwa]